ncbi:Cytoplasmic phosphatidylinositol transfer protein 1 Mammalian rdgB -like protein beta [Channa argus]|uniref:Cytoplasmic phosphatidylinositol transfer protein 1 Mammalian rdgB-like protein beta n=1 Tax=Channa argus TaxID=215402 RepID=A0A6G1QD47_CHAAH|nr:Cytoplasmic phosphatidylinositol transfer protein 1 Mammalian rdgB -like protein beta [Channa argus]
MGQYQIGQLYMISKHSHEQSERGEGVEVVQNEPYEDPEHGSGQFTEKRIYLNNKLPSWARAVVPKIFYVTEKAWNYYPYTITVPLNTSVDPRGRFEGYAMLPGVTLYMKTKGRSSTQWWLSFSLTGPLTVPQIFVGEPREEETEVCFVDIAYDEIPERHYKESELFIQSYSFLARRVVKPNFDSPTNPMDLRCFKSKKTNRGLLKEGWIQTQDPVMCSYKLVTVKFEVWGLQTRVEQFVHKVIRDVLLLGHRQAFAWVDEWIDMTMEEVREYERATQEATNLKIGTFPPAISISETPLPSSSRSGPNSAPSTPLSTEAPEFLSVPKERPRKKSAPETLTLPDPGRRDSLFKLPSFFSWNSSPQPE